MLNTPDRDRAGTVADDSRQLNVRGGQTPRCAQDHNVKPTLQWLQRAGRKCAQRAARSAVLAATLMIAVPPGDVEAKFCKPRHVTAQSKPHSSRSLQALPGSIIAWRRAVKEQHGGAWSRWLRSQDRAVFCDQITTGEDTGKWVCARTARPCSGPLGKEEKPRCQLPIVVIGPLDNIRDVAAQSAKDRWRQTALDQFGASYAIWSRSYDRKVRCDFATGTYRCEAAATPCRALTDEEVAKEGGRLPGPSQ